MPTIYEEGGQQEAISFARKVDCSAHSALYRPRAPARPSVRFLPSDTNLFRLVQTTEHGNQLKGNQPEKLWINTKNGSNNHFPLKG